MQNKLTKILIGVFLVASMVGFYSSGGAVRVGATVLFPYQGGTGADTSDWDGFLRVSNGTWATSTPTFAGGSDTEVQFNSNGDLIGDPSFIFSSSTGTLSIPTSTFGGPLDINSQNLDDAGNITFQTGATGGTIRTGTSNADKWQLQAYDVDDSIYRTILTANAGNTVTFLLGQALDANSQNITGISDLSVNGTSTLAKIDYENAISSFLSVGNTGASNTFSFATSTNHRATINATTTLTISNVGDGQRGMLSLYGDGVASYGLTFSGIDRWIGDAPALSPETASSTLVVTVVNDGANVIASSGTAE